MAKFSLDDTDRKILTYLTTNARMPFLEIARECGISGAAIHQRVKKLEDAGVIDGSRMMVNPKVVGYEVCAFVGVQITEPNVTKDVIGSLSKIPEVVECHFITGRNTLLLKIYCTNNEHLMHVLVNTIQYIPGIHQTETFISLDQPFSREVAIF
ncbi:Transcriptional regulator, AsnC family [Mucinivorans hirudinis]|uniref:Transcriptional regulator, AsnC family n=1 Tax=Mucinivorans hirudinis TaxID=1433126 RepID=A0A060R9F3_9BACT|nr:Transcriptional regulator, AsnC family [Mucinivorans hirudinis]